MQNIPPQLSEATFRTYEPYLHRAIQAWPDETKWTPDQMVNEASRKTLSPHTFAARLRDAVVSYNRFGWNSYIDRNKFCQIFGQFAVSYDVDGSVWFRNRGRRGRPSALTKSADAVDRGAVPPPSPVWSDWTDAEVRAAALLVATHRILGPILFKGEVPTPLISELLASYDIGLYFDSSLNQTILS